jgi:hypothetical protein
MTIIKGIEIDIINYKRNIIKDAIENNSPIEDKLHVIAVISNPCLYAKRYILMKDFIKRFENDEPNCILYIVELAYGNQKFIITDSNNNKHLQLRTDIPIWHKENMINLGVKKLLPKSWKAFAWIDADLEFENNTWASDTLKILNGTKDIVQIFSHCVDMDNNEMTMKVMNSAGYQYTKQKQYTTNNENFWHPGFAWAMTRKAFERVGGLYEVSILGSGDHIMMHCLLNNGKNSISSTNTDDYKNSILEYEKKFCKLRFGYVPGVIRHYYHGSKKNRGYQERWKILVNHKYSPILHIQKDSNGLIIPTKEFSKELQQEIFDYFASRNEDDK